MWTFVTGPFGMDQVSSLRVQLVKNPPAMQEIPVQFLGREDPLEKGIHKEMEKQTFGRQKFSGSCRDNRTRVVSGV